MKSKRIKRGRKPVADKKEQINIYVRGSVIAAHGGRVALARELLRCAGLEE